MDQIVFVIDLESFLPESTDEDVESLVERGLHDLKEAALKVLTHGRVFERRGDISSFGFRSDFVVYFFYITIIFLFHSIPTCYVFNSFMF